jgi:SAM-dependent methyltransferase/methyltransferase-like protein
MSEPSVARSYDDVPYDVGAVPGAHPDTLAVLGRLRGMQPPDVERCRVLELGCSTGENLLALAAALPHAEFFGIDASPAQIETGTRRLRTLGVANVTLECRLIEELQASGRTYDYILCHGVYSWVPLPVRQRILALTAELLAPHGLAFISFNTPPGWHMRQQLRNLLLFHLEGQDGARERIAQARALLEFLADALRDRTDAYGALLLEAVAALRRESDAYLLHEFLEDVNEPEYFSAFVARAASHGLQYVDNVVPLQDARVSAATRETLVASGADRVGLEQYVDFLGGSGFRRVALCRGDIRLADATPGGALPAMRVSAAAAPERADAELTSDATEAFRFAGGPRIETNHPAMKTALAELGSRYPQSIAFAELCDTVRARLMAGGAHGTVAGANGTEEIDELLANWLHQCYRNSLVELHLWQAPFTLEPSERPRASVLARAEAAADSPLVTSLRHTLVSVQPFDRSVLARLDGTVGVDELAALLNDEGRASGELARAGAVAQAVRRLALSAVVLAEESTTK